MIWELLGWALVGGALGYLRIRFPRTLVTLAVFFLGLSFLADPSPPDFKLDYSWWNTVAFLVGFVWGAAIGHRDEDVR